METPLIDSDFVLHKFHGKGGWTYAEIPASLLKRARSSGWVRVKGFIDDFKIAGFNLMPMADNKLMCPVKTEIRKKINKKKETQFTSFFMKTKLNKKYRKN